MVWVFFSREATHSIMDSFGLSMLIGSSTCRQWTVAIVIPRVWAVSALVELPLAESKEWSSWLVFVAFPCLVAAAVVVVFVMMLVAAVVVDAVWSCSPLLPLVAVVPTHEWKYDSLVYTPNNVQWRGPRHLRQNLRASTADQSKTFPSSWCVFASSWHDILPEMEATPSEGSTVKIKCILQQWWVGVLRAYSRGRNVKSNAST